MQCVVWQCFIAQTHLKNFPKMKTFQKNREVFDRKCVSCLGEEGGVQGYSL